MTLDVTVFARTSGAHKCRFRRSTDRWQVRQYRAVSARPKRYRSVAIAVLLSMVCCHHSASAGGGLRPANRGPQDERHAAAGWVFLSHDGCLPADVSQSTQGIFARRLAPLRYRAYFLKLRSIQGGEEGGYDTRSWAAFDVTLKPHDASAHDHVTAPFVATSMHLAQSPLHDELVTDHCS
jgi:hypothetical protein